MHRPADAMRNPRLVFSAVVPNDRGEKPLSMTDPRGSLGQALRGRAGQASAATERGTKSRRMLFTSKATQAGAWSGRRPLNELRLFHQQENSLRNSYWTIAWSLSIECHRMGSRTQYCPLSRRLLGRWEAHLTGAAMEAPGREKNLRSPSCIRAK